MDMNVILQENYQKIFDGSEFKGLFNEYYKLLLEYNEKYNLTTILQPQDVFYKHFLDCSAAEFLLPKNALVAEVGSGAGFPSLVLKMLRSDLKFILMESIGKKCEFLRVVCEKLHLSDVTVLCGRAEDFAKDVKYREKADVVCARAVARLNTLSEYCIPFVKKGGIFVAYKSGDEEELSESKKAFELLGGKLKENIVYDLPQGYGKRSLVVVEKVKYTLPKYPRGNGKERKCPLL